MSALNITVTHGGEKYSGTPGKITSTQLGVHSHYGIFTFGLTIEGGGSGVVAGNMTLDAPPAEGQKYRQPRAYGLAVITEVLRTVGVDSWEDLKGQHVVALFPYQERGGTWGLECVGIAHPIEGRALIFKEHAKTFRNNQEETQ